MDTTWHFLLCLDPDGARLNEPWPPGPPTLFDYHRPFFRPAGAEQPEWAPFLRSPDDVLPETRALTEVIDELEPFLQCSLHGHDVGGSWVQLTRDLPGLAKPFAESAASVDVPVEHGPFDTLLWPSPGPGVFVMPAPEVWESFPTLVDDVDRSTWGAPHRYGGMTATVEVPAWASWLMEDRSAHPAPGSALRSYAARLRDRGRVANGFLTDARERLHGEDSPLLRAVNATVGACSGVADEWDRLAASRPGGPMPALTRGHVAELESFARRAPLRAAAMVLYLLDGARDPAVLTLHQEVADFMAEQCEALETTFQPRWIPVGHQVRHQAQTVVEVFTKALERA